jgi:hypothetical protein
MMRSQSRHRPSTDRGHDQSGNANRRGRSDRSALLSAFRATRIIVVNTFRNGLRILVPLIALAGCGGRPAHSALLIDITFDGVCIPEICVEQDAKIADGLALQLAKVPKCAAVQIYASGSELERARATGNRWSLTVTRHFGPGPTTLTWILTDNTGGRHDGRGDLDQIASDVCRVIDSPA